MPEAVHELGPHHGYARLLAERFKTARDRAMRLQIGTYGSADLQAAPHDPSPLQPAATHSRGEGPARGQLLARLRANPSSKRVHAILNMCLVLISVRDTVMVTRYFILETKSHNL